MSDFPTCEHNKKTIIQSGRWTGSDDYHGHERIMICDDCGRVFADGSYNGHRWQTTFRIDNPKHIEILKRYAQSVYGEDEYSTIVEME